MGTKHIKPLATAVGASLALSISGIAIANTPAAANPFQTLQLTSGYQNADLAPNHSLVGKRLAEGSCSGEGGCGEGSCGGGQQDDATSQQGAPQAAPDSGQDNQPQQPSDDNTTSEDDA